MSASLAAYQVAMAELFESSPRCYFWTFTFVHTQPVWRATQAWAWLQRDLFNWAGRFQGVRVAEMHRDHGLHFHAVINVRLPVYVVRRMGRRYGFGRIEAQAIRSQGGTTRYLVKYLAKGERLPSPGMRRFTRFGGVGEPVKNFVCESDLAKEIRKVLGSAQAAMKRRMTRKERFLLVKAVRISWDSGAYLRPASSDFELHNDREITVDALPVMRAPRKRNQWNS